ncbi:hypothetical protein PG991_008460 [Apiospora marii]|uniref:Uncharacterized protein n=1 Tax=Apiospora marii TaxID=335849 RepID=A0ABR1RL26_9PEZI
MEEENGKRIIDTPVAAADNGATGHGPSKVKVDADADADKDSDADKNKDNDASKPPEKEKGNQVVVKQEGRPRRRPPKSRPGESIHGKITWEKWCQEKWGGDMDDAAKQQDLLFNIHKAPESVVLKQEEESDGETEDRN